MPPAPTEHQIQAAFVKWVRMMRTQDTKYRLIYAVPNGAWLAGFAAVGKLKAEGQENGVPDICIDCPCGGYHGARIEFKRPGGRISEEQTYWARILSEAGFLCTVQYTTDGAIEFTKKYLSAPKTITH